MQIFVTGPRECFSVQECAVYYSKQETEPLRAVRQELREQ